MEFSLLFIFYFRRNIKEMKYKENLQGLDHTLNQNRLHNNLIQTNSTRYFVFSPISLVTWLQGSQGDHQINLKDNTFFF